MIGCLVFIYLSSGCFLRGRSGTMCFIPWIAFRSDRLALFWHAFYSAAFSTEATATFMFLPTCNKRMTRSPCASLYDRSPHLCKFLGSIPSDQLQIAEVPFWNNKQTPIPKHTRDMHIIAIWNTEGRILPQCLQQKLAKRACQIIS